jgi:tetratricopeptide (TPR) repeat protein
VNFVSRFRLLCLGANDCHFAANDLYKFRDSRCLVDESNALIAMKSIHPQVPDGSRWVARLAVGVLVGCLLVVIVAILLPVQRQNPAAPADRASSASGRMTVTHSGRGLDTRLWRADSTLTPARSAEEMVAEKMSQFARSRADIVDAIAKKFDVAVPDEVNRFFAAAQAGNWPETTNLFAAVQKLRQYTNSPPGLLKLWPAIVETFGVAEQAHLWPAQQLLDYGNAVLDSLRPGMVYVGGNDAGRFIPTLLTETSGGEPHIVLTQNALADNSYLDYVKFRYGDQLATLTFAESQSAFQSYIADAQKRLQHDQQFPNEPKQLRPGEDVQMTDGRVQVGGQVAVMAINERLLQTLLQKNPDLPFALEESFPLSSFYAGATTLGPITELRAADTAAALTPERAAQSLDYWRSTIQPLLADPDLGPAPRDAYVKQILGQANLFVDRNFSAEAEQAFQLATSLSPANPVGVFSYVNLLTQQHRYDEARQLVQNAINTAPDNQQFRELLTSLGRMK